MTPDATFAPPAAGAPRLRLVEPAPLRLVDVALLHGERAGRTRAYLEARHAALRAGGEVDHHVLALGPGHRDVAALRDAVARLAPDVVLLHDPFWGAPGVADVVRRAGGLVVAVHHGSRTGDAAGLLRPALRGWLRHAYRAADAVMAAEDPRPDCGRAATIPLRVGVDAAFRPRPGIRRGERVVYAGRLARDKGLETLLEAAALSIDRWPLELIGDGPLADRLHARIRRYGLSDRVTLTGRIDAPAALARRFAAASCVVMPGGHETYGRVALEAAATGARVVGCRGVPAMQLVGGLGHGFEPGDAHGLARAIARARCAPRDLEAAGALARRSTWEAALAAELRDLAALAGRDQAGRPCSASVRFA